VELGENDRGMVVRIDNFLENLREITFRHADTLAGLGMERENIRAELEKKENYTDIIEELKAEIAKIDEELGVKKDE
jgi:hypothetical protein